MSDIVKHMAASLPFPMSLERLVKGLNMPVVFPFYHTVVSHKPKHLEHLYPLKGPKEFEEDLNFLLQYFNPVSLQDLRKGVKKSNDKPNMVLSFDDGLAECYEIAMPILLRKGVPAAFFLNNDFIDNEGLFYRYKISLLLEKYATVSGDEMEAAAELMSCKVSQLKGAIQGISYVRREITDNLATLWGFSFDDYQRINYVYLNSMQIQNMISKGFEFGAHGTDHPMFSILTSEQAVEEIKISVEDICNRFSLDYRYFAFPFTDYGVSNDTIRILFEREIIDMGFGTAGLKNDIFERYYQRIPMEFSGNSGKNILKGELVRRLMRRVGNRNMAVRKPTEDELKGDR